MRLLLEVRQERYRVIRCDMGSHFLTLFREKLKKLYASNGLEMPEVRYGSTYGPQGLSAVEYPHSQFNALLRIHLGFGPGPTDFARIQDKDGNETWDYRKTWTLAAAPAEVEGEEDEEGLASKKSVQWVKLVPLIMRILEVAPVPSWDGYNVLELSRGRSFFNPRKAVQYSTDIHTNALEDVAAFARQRRGACDAREQSRLQSNLKSQKKFYETIDPHESIQAGSLVLRERQTAVKLDLRKVKTIFVVTKRSTSSVWIQRLDGRSLKLRNPVSLNIITQIKMTEEKILLTLAH